MPRATITSDDLRRFAVARSLFPPTTLRRAIARMRFVQADPIRAPARAQDLILRHRVKDYRAGDLERNYVSLEIEEDTFVNYGFVTRELQTLMHPRPDVRVPAEGMQTWSAAERKKAELLIAFLQSRGEVHPREVEEHFAHGRVRNYWGGSSNATTHMLDALHYRGLVRVVRRENGIRIYRAHQHEPALLREAERRTRIDALVDVVVNIYAPLPGSSLSFYIRRLRYAVPQEMKSQPRRNAHVSASLMRVSRAWTGIGPKERIRVGPSFQSRCDCWRRSIRSCTTAPVSNCCGTGPTVSKHTHRRRNGS
jgi:uncharacterized protein